MLELKLFPSEHQTHKRTEVGDVTFLNVHCWHPVVRQLKMHQQNTVRYEASLTAHFDKTESEDIRDRVTSVS